MHSTYLRDICSDVENVAIYSPPASVKIPMLFTRLPDLRIIANLNFRAEGIPVGAAGIVGLFVGEALLVGFDLHAEEPFFMPFVYEEIGFTGTKIHPTADGPLKDPIHLVSPSHH